VSAPIIEPPASAIELWWLPVGAGGHFVRANGWLFEVATAILQRRRPAALYHSALEVRLDGRRFVIEQAPVRDDLGMSRGVVAEGSVGAGWAGRLRLFRYEIRRWEGGSIPDADEAVASPVRVTDDRLLAARLLELALQVPTPVWGRDELGAGEMWNSNSVVAWLLARSGVECRAIRPPHGGRAPGWNAGLLVAARADPGLWT
jgi:hypothetical protein